MKLVKNIILFFLGSLVLGCSKEAIDDQKPEINMDWDGAFPLNCDTLYIGESFNFKAIFSDNAELGSYSIDIHNNFNHHSHSTDVSECSLDPVKDAVEPFLFIHEYDIPEGNKKIEAIAPISIPDNVDEGDYHMFISLTDREGWRAEKGLSIKIIKR